jgi:hypothetical protein
MSEVGDAFRRAFDPPDPAVADGLPEGTANGYWAELKEEVGSGYFMDRFLYLFGEGLQDLRVCLDAWSFIVPPHEHRVILGYNAYGSLLVLEENPAAPWKGRVHILDPLIVTYGTLPSLDFIGLIGSWLPEKRIPGFFETSVYERWCAESEAYLDPREILGIGVPLSLGGEMRLDNFAPQDIVEYYQTSGPIYERALRKKAKSK